MIKIFSKETIIYNRKIEEYIKAISKFKKPIQETNLGYLNTGKINYKQESFADVLDIL